MIKIDNSLLQDIGLGSLPAQEKDSLLKHIYETLEMRVGMRLADQMTNQQLDEFERYFEAKDDAGAFKWLETNFPNYKDVVQEEFDKLKSEVQAAAPQILAAAQQSPQPQFATPPVDDSQQMPLTQSPQQLPVPPTPDPATPVQPQAPDPQDPQQQPYPPQPPQQPPYGAPGQQPPAGPGF